MMMAPVRILLFPVLIVAAALACDSEQPTQPDADPDPDSKPEEEGTGGMGTWFRTGGPLGGLGYDIRMRPDDPDILFVTDGWAGVFRSSDGGESWSPTNDGITAREAATADAIPTFSLTIDHHDRDILMEREVVEVEKG